MSDTTQRLVAVVAEHDREIMRLRLENERLRQRLAAITAVVDAQAEDDGLWFLAATATEAYLQQELRRLHAAVEGER